MDVTLRTLVVVPIVVAQIWVATAALTGAIAATPTETGGTLHAAGGEPAPDPARERGLPLPPAIGDGIADVVESAGKVVPGLVLPAAGYSRRSGSDPLDNESRRTIVEAVREAPGTYVAAIAGETDLSASSVRYHLKVLEEDGVLRTEKVRGRRRVFAGQGTDVDVAAALNDDATAAVIEAVDRVEPATVSAVADEIDRTPGTASYHLSRLEDAGLVDRERDGARTLVSLEPTVRARLEGANVDP